MTARMRVLLGNPRRALVTAGTVAAVATMAVLPFALRAAASAAPELTAASSVTTRDQEASATASCGRGYTAVGVSAELSGFADVRISKMWPQGRNATARGTATSRVTSQWTLKVQAICVKDNAGIVAVTSSSPPGSGLAGATCQPGRTLVGFGWSAEGDGRILAVDAYRGGGGAWPTGTGQYPSGTGQYPTGSGQYPTGGWPTGTGGWPTGGWPSATGGWPTGGWPSGTGGWPTGGWPSGTGQYPTGGWPTGGWPSATGGWPTGGWPSATGGWPTGGWPSGTGQYPTGTGQYPTGGWPTGGWPSGTGSWPTGGWPSGTGGWPTGGWPSGTGGWPTGGWPTGTGGYPTGGNGSGPFMTVAAAAPPANNVAVTAICARQDFGVTSANTVGSPTADGTVQASARCEADAEVSSLGFSTSSGFAKLRSASVAANGRSGKIVVTHPNRQQAGVATLTAYCSY